MPVPGRRRSVYVSGIAAVLASLETGCAYSPSMAVLGAYFPDWLFCIVAGVVLTVIVYQVAARLPAGRRIGPSAVVYPTLVTLLALITWLVFFKQ